jgi:hypothetical protein
MRFSTFGLLLVLCCNLAQAGEYKLVQKFPTELLRTLKGGTPDADGMVGSNKAAFKEAGAQRSAMDTLILGAAFKEQSWVDQGLKVIEATYARQRPGGNFGQEGGDGVTSVAYWTAEVARALLVLDESKLYKEERSQAKQYYGEIRRSLRYLVRNFGKITADTRSTSRLLACANAFALGSKLVEDPAFFEYAQKLLDIALSQYDPKTGVFSENSGYDSSYQAISLVKLSQFYLHYPSYQTERIQAILHKGIAWEVGRISEDGTISAIGNTRTGLGQETDGKGKPKEVSYKEVLRAILYHNLLFKDRASAEAANRLYEKMQTLNAIR